MAIKLSLYIDEALSYAPWIKDCLVGELKDHARIVLRPHFSILGVNVLDQSNQSINSDHLNLQFSGVNLNLFSDTDEQLFKFKTEDELKSLISHVKRYIEVGIDSLNQRLTHSSNLNYKNIDLSSLEHYDEQLYLRILSCSNFSDLNLILDKYNSNFICAEISSLREEDFDSKVYVFEEDDSICLISKDKSLELDITVLKSIKDLLNKFNVMNGHKGSRDLAHIFTHLPYPVAILNLEDQSYSFNTEFSNLGINTKTLSSYKDGESVDITNVGKMKIVKTVLSKEFESISFIKIEQLEVNFSDQSQEELGIVSSSIAHELNNPLGGILAALDVLLLDDSPSEIEEKFCQMKEGVQRCKELVETFLSFSRKKQIDTNSKMNLDQVLDQVIQLSRFRLIESNNQIKLQFNKVRENKYIKNSHLMTMCLYLIVGELLTMSSRDDLLKQTALSRSLNLKVTEDIDKIIIDLDDTLMLSTDFLASKLFNYIIDILRLKIIEDKRQKVLSFY